MHILNTPHLRRAIHAPQMSTSLLILTRLNHETDFSGTIELPLRHPYSWDACTLSSLPVSAYADSIVLRFTDGTVHDRATVHDDIMQTSLHLPLDIALTLIDWP